MSKPDWSQLLLAALETELGLVLRTNDPDRAKAQLYSTRRELGGEALRLQLRSVPGQSQLLFLVKGNPLSSEKNL